jgi:hypothetical protein
MLDDEICPCCGKKDSEHTLKPAFIRKMKRIQKQKAIPFKNIQELRKCIESDN